MSNNAVQSGEKAAECMKTGDIKCVVSEMNSCSLAVVAATKVSLLRSTSSGICSML